MVIPNWHQSIYTFLTRYPYMPAPGAMAMHN
jgi:hypothetical protein